MIDTQQFRNDVWVISLPADWQQKPAQDQAGTDYFESGDGTKRLHILTSRLGPDDLRSMSDVVRAFKQSDGQARKAMQGHAWEVLVDSGACAKGSYIGVTECLSAARHYRTVSKIIAAPPLVVRAAFEDYACVDLNASRAYFHPLVESLRLPSSE